MTGCEGDGWKRWYILLMLVGKKTLVWLARYFSVREQNGGKGSKEKRSKGRRRIRRFAIRQFEGESYPTIPGRASSPIRDHRDYLDVAGDQQDYYQDWPEDQPVYPKKKCNRRNRCKSRKEVCHKVVMSDMVCVPIGRGCTSDKGCPDVGTAINGLITGTCDLKKSQCVYDRFAMII